MGAANALQFIGRSDEEREALKRLIDREDEIFNPQPGEEGSLAVHVRSDIPRFQILNARHKLTNAVMERKSDRNLMATIIVGVIVFAKSGITWAEIIAWVHSL